MVTDVKPSDLNYDKYQTKKYDNDIVRSIPGHKKLHQVISTVLKKHKKKNNVQKILDLGCGTGLTSQLIMKIFPKTKIVLVDFSKQMLDGAKKKLKKYDSSFKLGDYSKINFGKKYDIITTVIGLHHQSDSGKKKLFKKIYNSLNDNGLFLFADLMTYEDKYEAAFSNAQHYAQLVKNSKNEESLREWAHHHMFLNKLTTLTKQLRFLENAGFENHVLFRKFNTILILSRKIK